MMIYTEITPNPAALKFVVEKTLMERGSADFPSPDTADDSILAKALFQFKFVKGVFIGSSFVSVTKEDEFSWEELIPQIKDSLRSFLESGQPAVSNLPEPETLSPVEESEIVKRIKQLLDESIRPAVAMDGGDVLFDSFDDGLVKLRLQGACSGCPSSTMTLKMGIEGLLTRMIPEVKTVEAV